MARVRSVKNKGSKEHGPGGHVTAKAMEADMLAEAMVVIMVTIAQALAMVIF